MISSIKTDLTQLEEQRVSSVSNSEKANTLVEYMKQPIMQSTEGNPSLHERVISLPFYKHLFKKDISPDQLLLHFVNIAAIFDKLETLIKASKVYHQIIGNNIFRHEQAEKDITFFREKFFLSRPAITKETREFLDFMDNTVQHFPQGLLALLYAQYPGLFQGRVVCNATANWLKEKVENWTSMPEDNRGLSYWNFQGLPTTEDLRLKKEEVLNGINQQDNSLSILDRNRLQAIVIQAFEHNIRSIQSVIPEK